MAPLKCSRCQNVNPPEAQYCFFDGCALGNPVAAANRTAYRVFPSPFVLPSGRACRDFDELATACWQEWDVAVRTLREGHFANFLSNMDRADLAQAAHAAAAESDPDRGLDAFIDRLPSKILKPAVLVAEPLHYEMPLKVGEERKIEIKLVNQGERLVTGTLACTGEPFLSTQPKANVRQKLFQFRTEMVITLHTRAKAVVARPRPQEAQIVIETNGGSVTVPVIIQVPVTTIPNGVLAGAQTPRQLIDKVRAQPAEAALLFANGTVARWYKANGWRYPVQGQVTPAIAMDQFFVAMGLPRPKIVGAPVAVPAAVAVPVAAVAVPAAAPASRPAIKATPPAAVATRKTPRAGKAVKDKTLGRLPQAIPVSPPPATTPDWDASAPRTEPTPPVATMHSDAPPKRPGRAAPGAIAGGPHVRSLAPVELELDESALVPSQPAPPPSGAKRRWVLFFLLLLLLGGMVVHDYFFVKERSITVAAVEEVLPPLADPEPRLRIQYHDQDVSLIVGMNLDVKPVDPNKPQQGTQLRWVPTMRFGLTMIRQSKRLTYHEHGVTNNTVVKLDGTDWIWGESPFVGTDGKEIKEIGGNSLGQWKGTWQERDGTLGKDATGRQREGKRSAWLYGEEKVAVTQTVELVPGPQSRLLDTCLVTYKIENRDNRPHRVGLRFMLDTFIGANDGVPFTLPGAPELCDTQREFLTPQDVPDFLQALENADLANPGTIAHVQLKLGEGIEAPSRVSLGAWPNPKLRTKDQRCMQQMTLWDVPVLPIKSLTPGDPADSCVVLYWPEQELKAGATRNVGFSYGLGQVASGETKGQLGITVGGSFNIGGTFTVTALVSKPVSGQKLTLHLPPGLELVAGQSAEQPVPPASGERYSPVTWKVRAKQAGRQTLKITSSTGGLTQTLPVNITQRSIFE
jgi:hypothetical protein